MKESYTEEPATHRGLESCLDVPARAWGSVDRGKCRRVIELRNHRSRVRTLSPEGERNIGSRDIGEWLPAPAEFWDLACMDTFCTGIGRPGKLPGRRQAAKGVRQ